MKAIRFYFISLTACLLFLTSCSKDDNTLIDTEQETAILSFGPELIDLATKATSKQSVDDLPACTDDDASYVMIILSQDGSNIVGSEAAPFRVDLAPGQDFTVEVPELELTPGQYMLEYFAVHNEAGDLIWIAPNGGIFESFFEDPMPMIIDLGAGVKKYLEVPVVCFDDRFVNQYGYLFFELDTIEAIEFCIFGNYCDETGRHYPAAFSVDVWTYENGATGEQLYNDLSNEVTLNNDGDYAGTTVCMALPDTPGLNEYYVEITLLNSDAYGNVTEEVIRSGVITDQDVKDLFVGADANEYYHFREGNCNMDDSPNLFEEGGGSGNGGGTGSEQENFERNYFSLQNAEFDNRDLPTSNSEILEILQITGNSNILAGGTSLISVQATSNTTELIVGVQGQQGFFILPMDENQGNGTSEALFDLLLLIGQQAADSFTLIFTPSDGLGNYGPYETLQVTKQQAGTGLLQISLSWNQPNDMDLYLIQPDGEQIYFGNKISENGGELDVDSNIGCNIDGINNENIFYENAAGVTIQNGEYEVLIDLYSNCGVPNNTNYNVVAYYDGNKIAPTTGTNPASGQLNPNESNLISVMTFNIQDGAATTSTARKSSQAYNKASASNTVFYKLGYDKSNKVFAEFNPKIK
jgi:hypothetical protein